MSTSLTSKLVTANRVLANEGIIRGVGHVSVREPGADAMLVSRSRSPAFVTEEDVVRMDFDGTSSTPRTPGRTRKRSSTGPSTGSATT